MVDRGSAPPLVPAPAPRPEAPAAPPARPAASAPDASVGTRYVEEGNASWYGLPFNGRRSSNGEVYDMNRMTAAHRTLPFDTMVRVTNLSNGRSAVVRITDRGPFVDNRILDLSLAGARELDMVSTGVARVRLEVISHLDPAAIAAAYFTVQVGAFRERGNAERLRDRLLDLYPPVYIQTYDSPDGTFYRVQVGRVKGEDAARKFGETLRQREGFTPIVLRIDDPAKNGGQP